MSQTIISIRYSLFYTTMIAYLALLSSSASAHRAFAGNNLFFKAEPNSEIIQMSLQLEAYPADNLQLSPLDDVSPTARALRNHDFKTRYPEWFRERRPSRAAFATLFSPVGRENAVAIDFEPSNLGGVLLEIVNRVDGTQSVDYPTSFDFRTLQRTMASQAPLTSSTVINYGIPYFNIFNVLCHNEALSQIYEASVQPPPYSEHRVETVLSAIPVSDHRLLYASAGTGNFFNARIHNDNLYYSETPNPPIGVHLRHPDYQQHVTIRITRVSAETMRSWRRERGWLPRQSWGDWLRDIFIGNRFRQNNNRPDNPGVSFPTLPSFAIGSG
ncbi:hypothetical protein NX722_00805 [Endozoicomonas gorgoniicola]|uniref:Uncharacterized protein n=1 Tax=Endozoicomonas gorgoniicola TaxID=1234144 RepID=A0ABT3MQ35_9GAMM|nr:hypothetical protein [Endozoicomonas gorgoniicola]MCW7551218.1 hypothetical protein [Endozoicomonas gorgoniicola]